MLPDGLFDRSAPVTPHPPPEAAEPLNAGVKHRRVAAILAGAALIRLPQNRNV